MESIPEAFIHIDEDDAISIEDVWHILPCEIDLDILDRVCIKDLQVLCERLHLPNCNTKYMNLVKNVMHELCRKFMAEMKSQNPYYRNPVPNTHGWYYRSINDDQASHIRRMKEMVRNVKNWIIRINTIFREHEQKNEIACLFLFLPTNNIVFEHEQPFVDMEIIEPIAYQYGFHAVEHNQQLYFYGSFVQENLLVVDDILTSMGHLVKIAPPYMPIY